MVGVYAGVILALCVNAPIWLRGKGPRAQTLDSVGVLFVLCCFVYLMEHRAEAPLVSALV